MWQPLHENRAAGCTEPSRFRTNGCGRPIFNWARRSIGTDPDESCIAGGRRNYLADIDFDPTESPQQPPSPPLPSRDRTNYILELDFLALAAMVCEVQLCRANVDGSLLQGFNLVLANVAADSPFAILVNLILSTASLSIWLLNDSLSLQHVQKR